MVNFIDSLKTIRTQGVFNPWFESDVENDIDNNSPQKRLNNLKLYLSSRKSAKYLMVGEALGYKGGHFSGIPMTSERIITGGKSSDNIYPSHITLLPKLEQTSKILRGYTERTATIVWKTIIEYKVNPFDIVF